MNAVEVARLIISLDVKPIKGEWGYEPWRHGNRRGALAVDASGQEYELRSEFSNPDADDLRNVYLQPVGKPGSARNNWISVLANPDLEFTVRVPVNYIIWYGPRGDESFETAEELQSKLEEYRPNCIFSPWEESGYRLGGAKEMTGWHQRSVYPKTQEDFAGMTTFEMAQTRLSDWVFEVVAYPRINPDGTACDAEIADLIPEALK